MRRNTIWLGMLVLALASAPLIGCGGGGGSKKGGDGGKKSGGNSSAKRGYDSPQAVFDAAKAAIKERDFEKFLNTCTNDSRDAAVGMFAMVGVMSKEMATAFAPANQKDKVLEKLKPLTDVMSKHHVDSEAIKKKMDQLKKKKKPQPAEVKQMFISIGKTVEGRAKFVGDLMKTMLQMNPKSEEQMMPIEKNAKLVDVKVEGDKANGSIQTGKKKEPIAFKKTDSGWLIELPDKLFAGGMMGPGGPPTPPGPGVGGPGPELPPLPGKGKKK